jgi:hypothetical protein
MLFVTIILMIVVIITIFFMYLMIVRIRQLENELVDVRTKMVLTDDEIAHLSRNIMEFQKLKI